MPFDPQILLYKKGVMICVKTHSSPRTAIMLPRKASRCLTLRLKAQVDDTCDVTRKML